MFNYKQNEKGEFVTACSYCGEIFTGFSVINIKAKLSKHVLESKLKSHEPAKGIAQKELDKVQRYSARTKEQKRASRNNDMGLGW